MVDIRNDLMATGAARSAGAAILEAALDEGGPLLVIAKDVG